MSYSDIKDQAVRYVIEKNNKFWQSRIELIINWLPEPEREMLLKDMPEITGWISGNPKHETAENKINSVIEIFNYPYEFKEWLEKSCNPNNVINVNDGKLTFGIIHLNDRHYVQTDGHRANLFAWNGGTWIPKAKFYLLPEIAEIIASCAPSTTNTMVNLDESMRESDDHQIFMHIEADKNYVKFKK